MEKKRTFSGGRVFPDFRLLLLPLPPVSAWAIWSALSLLFLPAVPVRYSGCGFCSALAPPLLCRGHTGSRSTARRIRSTAATAAVRPTTSTILWQRKRKSRTDRQEKRYSLIAVLFCDLWPDLLVRHQSGYQQLRKVLPWRMHFTFRRCTPRSSSSLWLRSLFFAKMPPFTSWMSLFQSWPAVISWSHCLSSSKISVHSLLCSSGFWRSFWSSSGGCRWIRCRADERDQTRSVFEWGPEADLLHVLPLPLMSAIRQSRSDAGIRCLYRYHPDLYLFCTADVCWLRPIKLPDFRVWICFRVPCAVSPGRIRCHLYRRDPVFCSAFQRLSAFCSMHVPTLPTCSGDNWLSQTAYQKSLHLSCLFIGGLAAYTFVWDLGDVGIGLMTIFNMIALIPLVRTGDQFLKRLRTQRKIMPPHL